MRDEKSSAGAMRWETLVSTERKGFLKWLQELAAFVRFHNLSIIKIILLITSFNMLFTYSKNQLLFLMVWPVKTTLILIPSDECIEKRSRSSILTINAHPQFSARTTYRQRAGKRQHPDAANKRRKDEHDVISTRQEHLASRTAKYSREQIRDAQTLFFKLIKCYTVITEFKISKQFIWWLLYC